jgi:hypothetical protein
VNGTISGVIPSDRQVHTNPLVTGFDTNTGSGPDWYVVNDTGGLSCTNDIVATLIVQPSTNPLNCYQLRIITPNNTYTAATNAGGIASINQQSAGYPDGSDILFEVSKTCNTTLIEAPTYTIQFHF